jgi:hypothetical protein
MLAWRSSAMTILSRPAAGNARGGDSEQRYRHDDITCLIQLGLELCD